MTSETSTAGLTGGEWPCERSNAKAARWNRGGRKGLTMDSQIVAQRYPRFEETLLPVVSAEGWRHIVGHAYFTAEGAAVLGYHERCPDQSAPGKLAVYSIDHIPTGRQILWIYSEAEARLFIRKAADLPWDFRDPAEGEKLALAVDNIVTDLLREIRGAA